MPIHFPGCVPRDQDSTNLMFRREVCFCAFSETERDDRLALLGLKAAHPCWRAILPMNGGDGVRHRVLSVSFPTTCLLRELDKKNIYLVRYFAEGQCTSSGVSWVASSCIMCDTIFFVSRYIG